VPRGVSFAPRCGLWGAREPLGTSGGGGLLRSLGAARHRAAACPGLV